MDEQENEQDDFVDIMAASMENPESDEDEDGTDLGPQNKTLKTEVAKHKQELERLQQKVGHSLGFYTAVVACFVSHIDLFVQDVHK
jgi:hypothetical protein